MRIMLISAMDGSPWGGSEELWSESALKLLGRGHSVIVSVKSWPTIAEPIRRLAEKGADVSLRSTSITSRIRNRFQNPYSSILSAKRPDLVLISQGGNADGAFWMQACRRKDVPYAVIAHAAVPWYWPTDQEAEILRYAYSGAKTAFFVSKENVILTERQLGQELTNAKVIRNPYKVPRDERLEWPTGTTARWGCVARLDGYIKGHDILFDVLEQKKWQQRPLKVTLYGNGKNEGLFRSLKAKMRLKNVEFAGFVRQPVDIWRKEQCLVLSSRAEGLPITIVEAMLCGRPCIVTGVSGNPELLEDNFSGFISAGATIASLDEAMERAWRRLEEWPEIGARAAEAARRMVPSDPAGVFVDELLSLI